MLKWISFAMQLLALKSTFTKTTTAFEMFEHGLETVQSYFVFVVGFMVASLFFLIGLIVGIIGVGLQVENRVFFSFTGLMISAAIFFAISLCFYLLSYIALSIQKRKQAERQRLAEEAKAKEAAPLTVITDLLKQVFENLVKQHVPPPPPSENQD